MNYQRIARIFFATTAISFLAAGCATQKTVEKRSHVEWETMKAQDPISKNKAHNEMVQRVGYRVSKVVEDEMPDAEWEFIVFDYAGINAFAMPGGKVGVFRGLLDMVESDDELAIVIGHEVAHVTEGHSLERYNAQVLTNVGLLGLSVATSGTSQVAHSNIQNVAGLATQLGLLLPFSRSHEREADSVGLIYAAEAGYDPRAALTLWAKMAERAGDERPPQMLSTHPSHEDRTERLNKLMPEALAVYEVNKYKEEEERKRLAAEANRPEPPRPDARIINK